MNAARALALACVLALLGAGRADARTSSDFAGHHRQVFRVVVVRGLVVADLPLLASQGAVGLVVPNAGPRTSANDAFVGMVRGILYNARLPQPHGELVLIHVRSATSIPRKGPVIVIGLPPNRSVANDRRYPIAVIGHGFRPGSVLQSSLTRVPGLVSMAVVARTALEAGHSLRSRADPNPARTLDRLESRIRVARDSTMAAAVLVLSLLAMFVLFFPRGAAPALASALTANLALGWMLDGAVEPRVALLGVCTVAGGILGARFLRSGPALGAALVGVLGAYALTMAVHASALSLAPIGPELTSRFFGVSNQLETLLLVPALLVAAAVVYFTRPRRAACVMLSLLAALAASLLVNDSPGPVMIAGCAAVAALEGGLVYRLLTLPVLRRLGPVGAAVWPRPQE